MFDFLKKKEDIIEYNPNVEKPAVKSSICTGERVAGFMDVNTRKFRDFMLIKDDHELETFCRRCGITPDELIKFV